MQLEKNIQNSISSHTAKVGIKQYYMLELWRFIDIMTANIQVTNQTNDFLALRKSGFGYY